MVTVMDNKDGSFRQKLKEKSFYFSAVLAFAVIIASVVVSYYASDRKVIQNQTTTTAQTELSLPAEAEKTDVPDERPQLYEDETQQLPDETEEMTSATEETPTEEPQTKAVFENKEYVLPINETVTKWFSLDTQQYSKTMGDWRVHLGIDLEGQEGENVCSVGNGKVSNVVSDTKWGYIIEIDYGEFVVRYCGISQDGAVGIDQKVSAGEVIGKLSEIPCEALDGVHLHLEVIKDGVNVDPVKALGAF